jgi:hypothetical protein
MSFRKRGLEILEVMRSMEDGAIVHAVELQRRTGFSRALIVGSLTWLEDCAAVKLHLDERGRHCWTVNAEEPEEDSLVDPEPADLFESLADSGDLAGA